MRARQESCPTCHGERRPLSSLGPNAGRNQMLLKTVFFLLKIHYFPP